MSPHQRKTLWLSILAIVAYWVYELMVVFTQSDIPADMSLLFWKVLKVRVLILVVIAILMIVEKEHLSALGFKNKKVLDQIGAGLLSAFILFITISFGLLQLLQVIHPEPQEGTVFTSLISKVEHLPYWLFLGVFAGGFGEEIQRIFILTRFEKLAGRTGLLFALIFSSVLFGMGHLYQGVNGAIAAGTLGLVYGLLYLRNRSALEVISSHAIYDIMSILVVHFYYSL